ncbi:DDE-type integrase/transposase/recombinase [Planococcus sp. ISL-109]|nr:DDE-type integrase/transposase/recombinase [Planococcus sp. ISL-109]
MDGNIHPEATIHSDQGFHYTLPEFQQRVKELGLTQSMSSRGNCIDNTPMESFFGHFKDDVEFKQASSLAKLKAIVDDYMEQYNGTRKQRNFKKMTPGTIPNSSDGSLAAGYFFINCPLNGAQCSIKLLLFSVYLDKHIRRNIIMTEHTSHEHNHATAAFMVNHLIAN